MGIMPAYTLPTLCRRFGFNQVAIAQQYRVALGISINTDGKHRHHIGTVQVVGNFAKAFRLTLGTEHSARFVQAFQGCIVLGFDAGSATQGKLRWHRFHDQRLGSDPVGFWCKCLAIQGDIQQLQFLPVQVQLFRVGTLGISPQVQRRRHQGMVFV